MRSPYWWIAIGALLVTASELLLKTGATRGALLSGWTWLGIFTYILSFASWLYVLRKMPLSIAYSLITIVQVLVPLGAWIFLREQISPVRWAGIACVLCGTLMVGRSAATIEER
ncbi:MAG TPA: EamA family transporter [Thermoanaerobaculia bacterium]|nr:EamA family transporter [Thermoanaerobaculia bacterium]